MVQLHRAADKIHHLHLERKAVASLEGGKMEQRLEKELKRDQCHEEGRDGHSLKESQAHTPDLHKAWSHIMSALHTHPEHHLSWPKGIRKVILA